MEWKTRAYEYADAISHTHAGRWMPLVGYLLAIRILAKGYWSIGVISLIVFTILFLWEVKFRIDVNGITTSLGKKSWNEVSYYGKTESGLFFFDKNKRMVLAVAAPQNFDRTVIPRKVEPVDVKVSWRGAEVI